MTHVKEINFSDRSARAVGVVESDKRDKTRKVRIDYTVKHPKYGKYVRRRTFLQAHDEKNVSRQGDRVEIAECRPISKTKTWVVTRVVEAAAEEIPTITTGLED